MNITLHLRGTATHDLTDTASQMLEGVLAAAADIIGGFSVEEVNLTRRGAHHHWEAAVTADSVLTASQVGRGAAEALLAVGMLGVSQEPRVVAS